MSADRSLEPGQRRGQAGRFPLPRTLPARFLAVAVSHPVPYSLGSLLLELQDSEFVKGSLRCS